MTEKEEAVPLYLAAFEKARGPRREKGKSSNVCECDVINAICDLWNIMSGLHFCISDVAGVSCVSCELTSCAAIVQPLLKEPKYIIPSNVEEVDYICK